MLDDQRAARPYLPHELRKGLLLGLVRAVDVEVVGIGRGDDRHVGEEPQERTVELVGLDRQPGPLAQHEVAAEILGDAPQKGRAAAREPTVEPRRESRGRGLAMRTRHSHHILALGQMTEHLRAFLDRDTVVAEVTQLTVLLRHGGGVDHHRVAGVEEQSRNGLHVVVIMNGGPLGFEFGRQVRGGAVVTGHLPPLVEEVARQGAHADTPDT